MQRHRVRFLAVARWTLLLAFLAAASLASISAKPGNASAAAPLWVNDLQYGSAGGGFYWDSVSNQVWTGERGWHVFAPQPPRAFAPLWVNQLDYGSKGGGFYLDPLAGQVWTAERGWHLYNPTSGTPQPPMPPPSELPSIRTVDPVAPACVLRTGTPAERTLTVFGTGMATANFSGMHLNFQHQGSGAVSIHFDTEVVWSGTAAVVDIAKISHLLWSDTRMELRVRLTDANYQSLTDWSGSFLVAENGEACASAPLPQDPSPCTQSLGAAMDCSSRESVRIWAEKSTISTINAAVAALGSQQRSALAALLLDSNASGGARAQLLHAVEAILANSNLGFYAEIFAYTRVSLEGSGFFGACNQVWLAPGSFAGLNPTETRNVLAHEAFHSFNCVNRGPAGALNEGSAIFVFKAAWPGEFDDRETWAEATMGTKLYYRDLWSPPDPGYPIEAALSPTDKLNTVYAWLASRDGSRLPWNSTAKLQACYVAYFSSINRATAFDAWIVAQAVATSKMLNDSGCRPD